MRAARLLHLLVLLQNRGRLTARELAGLLEVSERTVLRDVDAMTEAGLPVVAHRGQGGGIEMGFGHRTRLLALTGEEAEAIGVVLAMRHAGLGALGLGAAAARAQAKLVEWLPDPVRRRMAEAARAFDLRPAPLPDDPRLPALALAVREGRAVRVGVGGPAPALVHPTGLRLDEAGWALIDGRTGAAVAQAEWGRINVSSRRFAEAPPH